MTGAAELMKSVKVYRLGEDPVEPEWVEHARRLLHVIADRQRWQAALAEARRKAAGETSPVFSATGPGA